MVGEKPVKVAQGRLMFCSWRGRHAKLSIKDLVTVAVVREKTVIVIGEDDLTVRNALRKSRRHETSSNAFQLLSRQVVGT